MTWDSKESELRCRIAAKCYKNRAVFGPIDLDKRGVIFLRLLLWLDCYKYQPASGLNPAHACIVHKTPNDIYLHYRFCLLLSDYFSLSEQGIVWKLISES